MIMVLVDGAFEPWVRPPTPTNLRTGSFRFLLNTYASAKFVIRGGVID